MKNTIITVDTCEMQKIVEDLQKDPGVLSKKEETDWEVLRNVCANSWRAGYKDRLLQIADKLEKLEKPTLSCSSIAIHAGYKLSNLELKQIYCLAEPAVLRGLEEGETIPFSVQHANESTGPQFATYESQFASLGMQSIATSKDIEFDENNVQSVVATTGGIPVVVPQEQTIGHLNLCPQDHHLKDGPCRRDYCWCQCNKCKSDCGEKCSAN